MRSLRALTVAVPAAAAAALLFTTVTAYANVTVTQVSSDPFTDSQAQHRTEVEPDTYTFGTTIVAAFQIGRVFGGGASDVGFATSKNAGATWTHGPLPGLTTNTGGRYGQASDASVAFDAKHNTWLISSLGIRSGSVDVLTSRSTDGGSTWSAPVTTATGSNDKNWIVCDNTTTSQFFGTCYTEYDRTSGGDVVQMRASTDGGATWGPARATADNAHGLGGQPVVRPNGTVVVPYESTSGQIRAFSSTNGGASWAASVLVSTIQDHTDAGNLRSEPLPSAETDAAGTTYVVWADCRFRTGCPANDIVLSTSTTGSSWTGPTRVPIDATTSTVDHFIPGIGVDATSSGATARIGLTYYFYPTSNCSSSTCRLDVGFISSTNGGTSWSAPVQIAGPMNLSWLPNTSQGRMFGDYISTSIRSGGNAFPVIPIGRAPTGSTFDLAMYTPTGGLPITGGAHRATQTPTAATAGARTAVPQTLH
jgi:BNR repeat-like domain